MICTIYKIYNDIDDDFYIGSTTQTPNERLSNHKSQSKTTRQSSLYTKMRLIGEEHFYIEVIEQYTYIGDKTERFVLEQDWIDILQPNLNKYRAYQTEEERKQHKKEYDRKYREENKEQITEYSKEYREEHKEHLKEQMKEYREEHKEHLNNRRKQPYLCLVCNVSITQHSKARHERSKKHYNLNLNHLQRTLNETEL